MVKIFFQGNQVAVHQRRYGGTRHGTKPEHMPSAHRRCAEWTPERFRRWGGKIGPQTEGLIVAIFAASGHPEQGPGRAEAVAERAVAHGAFTYQSITTTIAKKLDPAPMAADEAVLLHEKLRGAKYSH